MGSPARNRACCGLVGLVVKAVATKPKQGRLVGRTRALAVLGLAGWTFGGVGLVGCAGPGLSRAEGRPAGATLVGARVNGSRAVLRTSGRPAGQKRARVAKPPLGPVKGAVLEVGDSLGIDLGWGLQAELTGTGHEFLGEAAGDTGLAEPWYYDWPQHLESSLAQYHPGLVIVFLGANDVESLYQGGVFEPFGSPGWAAAYGQRVAAMIDEATTAEARVLWVGMPPMGSSSFSADMATLNAVYRAKAAQGGPDVAYFSSWTVLGTAQGQYEQGPPGPGSPWRAPDGVHITTQGADVLAAAVMANLRQRKWLAP